MAAVEREERNGVVDHRHDGEKEEGSEDQKGLGRRLILYAGRGGRGTHGMMLLSRPI